MGEHHLDVLAAALLPQAAQAVQRRDVQGGDGTHAQDEDGLVRLSVHMGDLVRRTEEHGAGDLVDHDVGGHGLKPALVVLGILHILPLPDHGHVGHACHEQQTGQGQAHGNGHHQITTVRKKVSTSTAMSLLGEVLTTLTTVRQPLIL